MFWKHFNDWSVDNMKVTRFTGHVYDFSVDYDPIAVDNIKNIHKHLMKKMISYKKFFKRVNVFIKFNKRNPLS